MHFGAGVGRDAPGRVDHRHLANVAPLVREKQSLQRVGRAAAGAHQREAERPVARIDEGLRGHGADARLGPRHDRPDREPVRLDGHAELPRRGVAGHDRVGVNGAMRNLRRRSGIQRERREKTRGDYRNALPHVATSFGGQS